MVFCFCFVFFLCPEVICRLLGNRTEALRKAKPTGTVFFSFFFFFFFFSYSLFIMIIESSVAHFGL